MFFFVTSGAELSYSLQPGYSPALQTLGFARVCSHCLRCPPLLCSPDQIFLCFKVFLKHHLFQEFFPGWRWEPSVLLVNSEALNCSSPCPEHSPLCGVVVTGILIFSHLIPQGKLPSNCYLLSVFECSMKNFL